jgi:hypothetical protein
MAIPFVCPHCGLKTDVDERYAGQSGPCAGCGQTVVIPWPGRPGTPAPSGGVSPVAIVVIVVVVLLLVVLVCGGLLVGTFFLRLSTPSGQMGGPVAIPAAPAVPGPFDPCSLNLKRIGLALHNYHDVYKCFPPAYVPDEKGKPKHSWRVLLLPFVEQQGLYAQYNFKEPFDGPANRRLAQTSVSVYQCPESAAAATSGAGASYVMLVGPGMLSDGPKSSKLADVRDGTSNTIAVVEIPGPGPNWMEPKDVTLDEFLAMFPRPGGPVQATNHPGVNVLLLDGSVRSLSTDTPLATIRAMATIAGGELVPP